MGLHKKPVAPEDVDAELLQIPPSTQELVDLSLLPTFARPGELTALPVDSLLEHGQAASVVHQLLDDQLMLNGNARQNLATFVTTWMPPEANALFANTLDKNMIDKNEYPQTAEIESRCVSIVSSLWNASDRLQPTGTSTTGSSEAVMLAGMALKWRWRDRQDRAFRTPQRRQ